MRRAAPARAECQERAEDFEAIARLIESGAVTPVID
jgi:hypothetical protein